MAFSSLKPCSRVMRASPHQTDQQAYYLLHDHEEQNQQEEAQGKEHVNSFRKNFCEESLPASTVNDLSCKEHLPTFIAHQGFTPLHLQRKNECKSDVGHAATSWFKKEQQRHDQLLCPLFQKDSLSPSSRHATLPPPEAPRRTHKLRFMCRDPIKQSGEQDHHNKQRTSCNKNACVSRNAYSISFEQATSAREELVVEKRRSSSAAVEDMIRFREVMRSKERHHDGRSSTWEDEVRQAMARSLIGKKQGEEVHDLQRSVSVKEYGTSVLPSTLLVKTTRGIGTKVDASCLESEPNEVGGHPLQETNAVEKRLWSGFNVKSPSEERWEEAAEVEEQRELQSRARSQSMRYDTSQPAEFMGVGGPWDAHSSENVVYHDDEWAVYKKSGYANLRPPRSGTFVAPVCCSSLLGRSLSMRDTRMGLVMECASCGAALHGASRHLLCFCSCCAAVRASSTQEKVAASTKKGGILRACRRLLGLCKKRPSDMQV